MVRTVLKILRILTGVALVYEGQLVLRVGGFSRSPSFHFNWGCFGLGMVLLIAGLVLFWPQILYPWRLGRST